MSGARGGTRHVNSILGLLCREHFPGIVKFAGKEEPAYTFAHYAAATDTQEGNVANKVIKEFWVSLPRTTSLNTLHLWSIIAIMPCLYAAPLQTRGWN